LTIAKGLVAGLRVPLVVLLATLACARAPWRPLPPAPDRASLTLPSGLRLLAEDDPSGHRAGVVLRVLAGSASDPEAEDGLAHLVEHLTYSARRAPGAPTVRERLSAAGAVPWNGMVQNDASSFYAFGAAAALDELIAIEVERLSDPLAGVDEAAFALERQVVEAELGTKDESGQLGTTRGLLNTLLFPAGHPYARYSGGNERSISALTLAKAQAFAAAHYRAERATLVIWGPNARARLAELAGRVPARLRGDPAHAVAPAWQRPQGDAPDPPAIRIGRAKIAVPREEVLIGWSLPPATGSDEVAVDLLARLVEGSVSSSTFRQAHPGIGGIGFYAVPGVHGSVLLARVGMVRTGLDNQRRAFAAVEEAVAAFFANPDGADQGAFEDMRVAERDGYLNRLDDPTSRLLLRARDFAGAGREDAFLDRDLALGRAALETVWALGRAHLTSFRARAVLIDPAQRSPRTFTALPTLGDHEAEPPKGDLLRFALPFTAAGEHQARLPNQLEVLLVPRPGAVVNVRLGFRGGASTTDPPGVLHALDSYRLPTTSAVARDGFTVDWSLDDDSFSYQAAVDATQLPALLERLRQEMGVRVTGAHGGITATNALAASQTSASYTAWAALRRALYGDHPRGAALAAGDLFALTEHELNGPLDQLRRPEKGVLVIVGTVDAKATLDLAARTLGRWTAPAVPATPVAPAPERPATAGAAPGTVVLVEQPRARQNLVELACLIPKGGRQNKARAQLLATILDRELMQATRARGSSYAVRAAVGRWVDDMVELRLSGRVASGALDELLRDLARLWTALPLDETALRRAQWRVINGWNGGLATGAAVSWFRYGAFATREKTGSVDDLNGLPAALVATTADDVHAAFSACRGRSALAITGDRAAVKDTLGRVWPEAAAAVAPR
jgi:zinc protease